MVTQTNREKTSRASAVRTRAAVLGKPWAADPESVRRAIQESLSRLPDAQRASYNRRVTEALSELGLNVPAILFTAGVVEQDPGDLTPSEVAHLFRYVRINLPWVLVDAEELFAGLDRKQFTRKKPLKPRFLPEAPGMPIEDKLRIAL
jgi:hypothetical protein